MASATAIESTKEEEQEHHRNSSSRIKRSVQMNGSQNKFANSPSEMLNHEKQDKPATNNSNKEIKENGIMEESKSRQQDIDKNDISALELTGSQSDISETT